MTHWKDCQLLKRKIAEVKHELDDKTDQIAVIPDLKKEVLSLEKDVRKQSIKEKALSEDLEVPVNIHRWRKLKATNPENFERIQKIQSLSRRLIAKSEEVNEKDKMIREKEKL